jgi:hypothetical protein
VSRNVGRPAIGNERQRASFVVAVLIKTAITGMSAKDRFPAR